MRTIVGGRPEKQSGGGDGLSRGIDVLLLKASVDGEFRDLLADDWRAAADAIGLDLTAAESAILKSVPGDVLADMSARMRVPESHRAVFHGKAAAAMLAILAGVSFAGCSPPPPAAAPPTPVVVVPADVNEPAEWSPRSGPVLILGIRPINLGEFSDPAAFESGNDAERRSDMDPASINEPFLWAPPPIFQSSFGASPEWNDRRRDHESSDEEEPEDS